jgi:hypothetical protein
MRPSLPEVRDALYIVAVFLLVVWVLASRASAQEWSGSLEFRGERIRVTSECGAVKGSGILRELEAGYRRAARDLAGTGVAVPKLGAPGWPYSIVLSRDPGCPGGAIACSTTPYAGAPKWATVEALCGGDVPKLRRGVRAVDHEAMHRWCLLVRPLVVPPKSIDDLRRVSEVCGLADHPHPVRKSYRFDVAGREVPK